MRAVSALRHRLIGVRRVVEQRPRLDEGGASARAGVIPQRGGLVVQVGQQHIGAIEAQAPFQLFPHVPQRRIAEGQRLQFLLGAPQGRLGNRELPHREYLHLTQGGNGLAGRGHDAADFFHLVAEEVDAQGPGQVAGEHVHRAAAQGEGAGAVQLAGVGIAFFLQQMGQSVKPIHGPVRLFPVIAPLHQAHRPAHLRRGRRQGANERRCRGHHHRGAPLLQAPCSFHALGHHRCIACAAGKGVIFAHWETQHPFVSQVSGHRTGEQGRFVFARHHYQRGLGPVGEAGRSQKRARRGRHRQRGVAAGVQFSPEVFQAAGLLQREGEGVYEHGGFLPLAKTAKAAENCG